MLAKASEVIGLNVIAIDNGKVVAKVRDIIYSPQQRKVLALLVDEGGWFSDAEVIVMGSVKSIGDDAVMIQSESVVKQATDVEGDLYNIREGDEHLTQVKVISEDGDVLGKATDIFFDPATGTVDELEVSQGLIENIKGGKKKIMVEDIITVGSDALVVSTFAEHDVDSQAEEQGLRGTLNKAKQDASEAYEHTKDQSKKTYEQVKDTVSSKADEVKNDPRVQEKMDQAREKAGSATDQLKGTAADVKDRAESGELKDQAKQKSGDAKGFLKEKYSEGMEYAEDKRKQMAVGQYVTMNVLSLNDEMIAKRGDLVTNDLLEKAEQRGVLDKVLGNTSKEPVR